MKLDAQEVEFTSAINHEKKTLDGLKAQAADIGQDELADTRLTLRPQMETEVQNRIRRAEGGRKINLWKLQGSIIDADKLLGEDGVAEQHKVRKRLQHMKERQKPRHETRAHHQGR